MVCLGCSVNEVADEDRESGFGKELVGFVDGGMVVCVGWDERGWLWRLVWRRCRCIGGMRKMMLVVYHGRECI